MTVQNQTVFRAGLLEEFWRDYEASVVDADAPAFQRRELKQSYLAGVVAYIAAEAAAACSANDADEFNVMHQSIDAEAMAMSQAIIDAAGNECDCDTCRAERGEDAGDVRVKAYAKGLNADQAAALAALIAEFVRGQCGGEKEQRTLN